MLPIRTLLQASLLSVVSFYLCQSPAIARVEAGGAEPIEPYRFERAIDQILAIRNAISLFEANRFRDAAAAFEPIQTSLLGEISTGRRQALDNYLVVSDYYAQALSQQGVVDGVTQIMLARHGWVSRLYDEHGYVYASSLSRLAEASYRGGDKTLAIAQGKQALGIFLKLHPVPVDAVRLMKSNLVQYQFAQFDTSMLPMDLSEFYTRCESLPSLALSQVDSVMAGFVEVGVDYRPEGDWRAYYAGLRQRAQSGPEGHVRLFIPASAEAAREEVCAVEVPAPIISAATGED